MTRPHRAEGRAQRDEDQRPTSWPPRPATRRRSPRHFRAALPQAAYRPAQNTREKIGHAAARSVDVSSQGSAAKRTPARRGRMCGALMPLCGATLSHSGKVDPPAKISNPLQYRVGASVAPGERRGSGRNALDASRDSSGAEAAWHDQFVHGRRVGPSPAGDRHRCHRVPFHKRPSNHLTAPQ